MIFSTSLFSQHHFLIPRNNFLRAVCDHRAERGAKGPTSWAHFVSTLFCQLVQAKSLLEISDNRSGQKCNVKFRHFSIFTQTPTFFQDKTVSPVEKSVGSVSFTVAAQSHLGMGFSCANYLY